MQERNRPRRSVQNILKMSVMQKLTSTSDWRENLQLLLLNSALIYPEYFREMEGIAKGSGAGQCVSTGLCH